MPAINTHAVTPIDLRFPPDQAVAVATALDQLLKACGAVIESDGKTYALAAFASPAAAEEAVRKDGDRFLAAAKPCFSNDDTYLWVCASSYNDTTLPAVLVREITLGDDILPRVLAACESPAMAEKLAAFNDLVHAPSSGLSPLRETLAQLALSEVTQELLDDLTCFPYDERVDATDHGRYVKTIGDVDPVAELLTNPHAAQDAMIERNVDYIATQEEQGISEAIESVWTDGTADDLLPPLETLGVDAAAVEERLNELASASTAYTGVIDLTLDGKCSIAARPMMQKEAIYLTFDGITSSAYNAVIDDSYCAMLDMLNIDVRSWVDHLAEIAGLPKPNWEIDLKGIVDAHLKKDARFDPATGFHWEGAEIREVLRAELTSAIFDQPSAEVGREKIQAAVAARQAYRQAVKDDAPEATLDTLHAAMERAQADAQFAESDSNAEYLFNLALQVVIADAEQLDKEWLEAAGVDTAALGAIESSTQQLQAFPQLVQCPGYCMALANLGSQGSLSHEWKNAPNKTPEAPALISHRKLVSIMENCSYSGNLVISFSCDLDELTKIGLAAQGDDPKEIRVDGAWLHIHDYINGAGDCEPLDGVWTFTTDQLRNKQLLLDNDATDSYGIAGVFGDFQADDCGIVIADPAPRAIKRLEETPAPSPM